MRWQKLGHIYTPQNLESKLATHAANPLPVHIGGDLYRVFFSGRDSTQRSSVGYFDFDIVRRKVIGQGDKAVFSFGPAGSFYSHGVSIGCCYEVAGVRYILFMGWHIPEGGHWVGEIGRLRLNEDFSLSLDAEQPALSISADDPVSLSYPWVVRQADGSYRMWYGTTVTWDAGNGEMLHVIGDARSSDGMTWVPEKRYVPFALNVAQAFSRPTIRMSGAGIYQMWFSYRSGSGSTYRIGYAESVNGVDWELKLDQSGIDVSSSGWDSEMIEYPFVLTHANETYMFYNGNGFGRSGVGLARLQE
ncbi:hypothetical protein [Shinella sp.]|uniref:hypothetical protein n=1 Tax=Shinella sp. TaxID=1870904 RepID=UPI0039E2FC59